MLLVYSDTTTSRLEFVSQFIGNEMFGASFQLTNDRKVFQSFRGPKINYSTDDFDTTAFHLEPHTILFETGIKSQEISCFEFNFQKAFFATNGDFPFDLFAASFYLLTRYEEYEKEDFQYQDSIGYREHFLDLPIINFWLNEFSVSLRNKLQLPDPKPRTLQHLLSYEVQPGSQITTAPTLSQRPSLWSKMRSLFAMEKEETVVAPPDVFEWLDALHLYCRSKPAYLFRLSGWLEQKNGHITPEALRQLVNYTSTNYPVGAAIEATNNTAAKWKESVEWFELLAEMNLKHLLAEGISVNDVNKLAKHNIDCLYSMNYAAINGFRAGTCSTFYWYDLYNETITDTIIFPIAVSDSVSKRSGTDPVAFYNELVQSYSKVKSVKGLFVTNWKTSLFRDPKFHEQWDKMFELFMRETVYWDDSYLVS